MTLPKPKLSKATAMSRMRLFWAMRAGLTSEQYAFKRGIDQSWFDFVDVALIAVPAGRLMQVFRLTDPGMTSPRCMYTTARPNRSLCELRRQRP